MWQPLWQSGSHVEAADPHTPPDLLLLVDSEGDLLTADTNTSGTSFPTQGACGGAVDFSEVASHTEGGVVAFVGPAASAHGLASLFELGEVRAGVPAVVVSGSTLAGLRSALGAFMRTAALVWAKDAGVDGADASVWADVCVLHAPPPWFQIVR